MELDFEQFEAICEYYRITPEDAFKYLDPYIEGLGRTKETLGHYSIYIGIIPELSCPPSFNICFTLNSPDETLKKVGYFNLSKHIGLNLH